MELLPGIYPPINLQPRLAVVLSLIDTASCWSVTPFTTATQRGFGGPANPASITALLPPVAAGAVAASAAPASAANPFDATSSAGIESSQRSSATAAAPGPALRVCGGAPGSFQLRGLPAGRCAAHSAQHRDGAVTDARLLLLLCLVSHCVAYVTSELSRGAAS